MSKRNGPMEDVKKQYVRMALESGNTAFIARKTGVSSSTLGNWIRQYRDEIEAEMEKDGVRPLSESTSTQELQKKYDHAMKLLGEKELEVAMLRQMVKKLTNLSEQITFAKEWIDEGFPASRVLKYASITRSTYYYRLANPPKAKVPTGGRPIPGYSLNRKTKKKVKDTSIKVYLMQLIEGEEEIYGYRKLTKALRRKHHLIINKKKVYRLCKELDILMPQREKKQKHLRRLAKNRKITGPNQLWQVDIKYGYVMNSRRFFYLVSAIDVFDRKIVGYYLGKTCEATKVTKMLMKAMMKRGVKMTSAEEVGQGESRLIIRSDNGPQFISNHFQQFSEDKFEHERIPPKSPNMNAYIESFHSVLERECYQKNEFITFDHAFNTVDAYIEFYNNRRYHGSLNDYSPSEYYAKWLAKSMDPVELTM